MKRKGNGKNCWSQNISQKQATLANGMYKVNSNPGGGHTCQRYAMREEVLDGSRKPEIGKYIRVGDKARFWKDKWIGDRNLKTLFPRLYSLFLDQGKKVGEVGVGRVSLAMAP